MTPKLLLFLVVGTLLMGFPIFLVSKKQDFAFWKSVLLTVLLTIVGTTGTFLMYYVENKTFGGLSFYGAVFFVPIVFPLISLILWTNYAKLMDLCAVGECIMLALMKLHCILGGCCTGRLLFTTSNGTAVFFPSRIVELIVALILFAVLLRWALQGKKTNELYGWYMILYGSTRFVLNIFREAWVTKEMLLPYGNIWSLVAIGIGIVWLLISRYKEEKYVFPVKYE